MGDVDHRESAASSPNHDTCTTTATHDHGDAQRGDDAHVAHANSCATGCCDDAPVASLGDCTGGCCDDDSVFTSNKESAAATAVAVAVVLTDPATDAPAQEERLELLGVAENCGCGDCCDGDTESGCTVKPTTGVAIVDGACCCGPPGAREEISCGEVGQWLGSQSDLTSLPSRAAGQRQQLTRRGGTSAAGLTSPHPPLRHPPLSNTQPTACQCALEVNEKGERGTLIVLLVLNLLLLVVEATLGWIAESTALLADSVDNLADATVYAVGLYAVGRSANMKLRAARLGGICQAVLALAVIGDIIRRAVSENEPESWIIIGVGIGALAVNILCLVLISRYRTGGVHMKASFIFSQNDVIANTATIITGIIILFTGADWLDLVVGSCIVVLVLYGSVMIFREVSREPVQPEPVPPGPDNAQADASSCCAAGIPVEHRRSHPSLLRVSEV